MRENKKIGKFDFTSAIQTRVDSFPISGEKVFFPFQNLLPINGQ